LILELMGFRRRRSRASSRDSLISAISLNV
jgi:hypothetical protein